MTYRYFWMQVRPGGEYRIRQCVEAGTVTVSHQGRSYSMPYYDGRTIAHAKTQGDADLICRLMNRGGRTGRRSAA